MTFCIFPMKGLVCPETTCDSGFVSKLDDDETNVSRQMTFSKKVLKKSNNEERKKPHHIVDTKDEMKPVKKSQNQFRKAKYN